MGAINAHREAGAKLRAAFAPEIAKVKQAYHTKDNSIDIRRLLTDGFDRHAIAIETYRFFVEPKDQLAYDKAWREYCEEGGSVNFNKYAIRDLDQVDHRFETFEQNIEAILRFTEVKFFAAIRAAFLGPLKFSSTQH